MSTATLQSLQSNSTGWLLFVRLTFGISIAAMLGFIFFMEGSLLMRGYLALNSLFLISSTIIMSKTMRDEHEAQSINRKISEAKTNKILKEYAE
ncbi:hypothetical protein GCM10009133_09010 [Cocleimonas flava]|uniref:YiaAB two helix domain-containing protein n=1 Tax=Cocleimonas flava TaxID=634765 RepID=A0A4R1F0H0_9GAMM|nr:MULTISPECIES: YiaA/YiaB family inner membrane protein [Cocleimonas]MEB8431876.1 YiaA/YiaB family inner membrane protein [Cocleimonas sp. KMM 6892]MEC4715038.1 YiaA/YiaB family inner membrane protein [Cocleimonas sp. KMM 6895]MEC4744148.1 YiaA/YiaB family inner membrane protein [Cocleimonas sp. KMM 6896]TCJ87263.1 hypothetical protein EV695_1771 [Cocleimonas flava]